MTYARNQALGTSGERVAEVDLERVVLNLLDNRADVGWGPNNTFKYPLRGGTGWMRYAKFGSAIIMGFAITGMHYTGMAAVRVTTDPDAAAPQGAAVFDLVFPVFVTSALVVAALLWMLFTADDDVLGEAV